MSIYNELNGPVAVLNLPKTNLALIIFAKAVHDHLEGNVYFPSPQPSLAVFAADIAALDQAETEAASGGKGKAKARDAKQKKVRADLLHLRDYVQSEVEKVGDPALAAVMIESAFMGIRKLMKRHKPVLRASNTDVSGTVRLDAKAVGPTVTYYWSYSLDQQTWISVPDTMQAKTLISGLTPGRTYYFRFRALTRAGTVDHCQPVALIVH
jgi:hypothetical protein